MTLSMKMAVIGKHDIIKTINIVVTREFLQTKYLLWIFLMTGYQPK